MNKFIKTIKPNRLEYEFLRSLNGLLDLTDRELELLAFLLLIDSERTKKDRDVNSLDCAISRKLIMKTLSITKYNLSRYLKMFREKQILIKDDGITSINKALIPIVIGNKVVQITMILKLKENEIQN